MSEKIEGTIEEIRFLNEENGFLIAVLDLNSEGFEYVYIKGYMPFVNEGEKYKLEGRWVTHHTYGEQFEVNGCELIHPKTVEEIEKYLASGIVKGIGPKLAAQIVEKFGEDTFDVMRFKPESLKAIHGIGNKKLMEIAESMKEEMDLRNVMIFLQGFGLSIGVATKIYMKLGSATVELISGNPYILAEEVERIGFKTADSVAFKLGIQPHSPFRINSAVKHIMSLISNNGDTFIPLHDLIEQSHDLITVSRQEIDVEIKEMIIRGELIADFDQSQENPNIYIPFFHYAEWKSAKKLAEIKLSVDNDMSFDETTLRELEEDMNIVLHDNQKGAIRQAVLSGVSVITGGPGTGKTTIINTLIGMFEASSKKVLLAAPTGRAAKRMTETTKHEAKTIHRLLEYQYSEEQKVLTFQRNEDNPLQGDVLIIDEFSMVDITLLYYLVDAIKPGMRLILVGDSDQLPSVGPGTVLRDIIQSKIVDATILTEIFRQSQESMIVVNAHKVNHGLMPVLNSKDKDFFFLGSKSSREALEKVLELCETRLPKYYNIDRMKDIHVLSITKTGDLGTNNLNVILQSKLNPPSEEKAEKQFGERIFRTGDKVMQIKNNYNKAFKLASGEDGTGVFNGDIGFIVEIHEDSKKIKVEFDDDKTVNYDFSELDELTLSYAMTVHKSQGSEYPVVVMPLAPSAPMLMNRNILYTAITRAKKLVVLVGSENVLARMVDTVGDAKRRSGLYRRLMTMDEIIS